jgi:hypothetical protein
MHDPDTYVTFQSKEDARKALDAKIIPVFESYESSLSFDRESDDQAMKLRERLVGIGVHASFSDMFSGEELRRHH